MLLISDCDGPSCGDSNFENPFRSGQLGQLFKAATHGGWWLAVCNSLLLNNVAEFPISGKVKDAESDYVKCKESNKYSKKKKDANSRLLASLESILNYPPSKRQPHHQVFSTPATATFQAGNSFLRVSASLGTAGGLAESLASAYGCH